MNGTKEHESMSMDTHEDKALAVIRDLSSESEDGLAEWDEIVKRLTKVRMTDDGPEKMTEEEVEDAVNTLMDRGQVFEPVLGKLRET